MAHPYQIHSDYSAGDKSSPARQLPAVAICCDAWEAAFHESYSRDKQEYFARTHANTAYRNSMPPLSGYQSICDFIACVAHGMAIEAIPDANGAKLLYAAQVALTTIRSQPKTRQASAV
jgi:hypothetical protein